MFPTRKNFGLVPGLICLNLIAVFTATSHAQELADEYLMAAGFYSRGQWEETASSFKSLIDRYPNTDEAAKGHFFLGEALMQMAEYGEAYNVYQVFIQRLPKHPFAARATFRMGEAAYRMKNLETAIRLLEIYVRENPHEELNEFALPYLGEIRLKRMEPQLAQRAYETALRLYPDSSLSNKCRMGLAKAFQMQGANDQALRFFEFLANDQQNPLAGQAHLQIGIIQFRAKEFEAAKKHLLMAVPNCQQLESRAESAYWLARTYIQEEDYKNAFELFDAFDEFDVNEQLATAMYFDGAVTATKVNQQNVALGWLKKLRKQYPNNALGDDALQLQIELEQETATPEQIVELTNQFVSDYPNSSWKPKVMEQAGRAHYALDEYSKCVAVFSKLLADGKHVSAESESIDLINWNYMLGLAYLAQKQFSDAEASLSQVDIELANDDVKPLVEIALATSRFGSKKFADAIPHYRNYLKLASEGSDVLRAQTELTVCLAEAGRWREAADSFDKLAMEHKNKGLVLETAEYLASKASQQNQPARAVKWYGYMSEPGNPEDVMARAISALAWIKMDNGDVDGAMQLFDRLLTECPNSEFGCQAAMARAKVFAEDGNHQEAAQLYGLVVRRFSDNEMVDVARLRRAYALQNSGNRNDLLEAKTLLTEYLQLPPAVGLQDEATYQLAWINHDLELPDDSQEKFQQLIDRYPNSKYWPDAVYRVAQYRLDKKETEIAKPLISRLVAREDIAPQIYSRGLYLQGELAAKEQRWDEVGRSMQMLLQRSNDEKLKTKANYWLAESLYRQQQYQAAADIFELLKSDRDQVAAAFQPWVWLRMAQCQGKLNKWDQALLTAADGKTRFTEFQAEYEFDFVIGRGLEDAGQLNESRLAYQEVIDSERGGATETAAIAQWRIGETFFHQEKYKAAIAAYYRVDSLFSYPEWRSAALIQAGKCQEHLGNWKHAMKLYKQLVEKFPDSKFAAAAKKRLERVVLLAQIQQETETR